MSISQLTRSLLEKCTVSLGQTLHARTTVASVNLVQSCSFHISSPLDKKKHGRYANYRVEKPLKSSEYTTKPQKMVHYGGRDEETGRVITARLGGGHKRVFRMVDWHRDRFVKDKKPLVEKVLKIRYDPNRSTNIALVAGNDKQRYIIPTMNQNVGDTFTTIVEPTKEKVEIKEGNVYPLSCIPTNTDISSVERYPGFGSSIARGAGSSCQVIRHNELDHTCVLKLPSGREAIVSNKCLAVVGKVVASSDLKKSKAGQNRWLGIRPKSGLFHKKKPHIGRFIHKKAKRAPKNSDQRSKEKKTLSKHTTLTLSNDFSQTHRRWNKIII